MLPFAQFSLEEESGKSRRIGASGVNSQFNRAEALLLPRLMDPYFERQMLIEGSHWHPETMDQKL